jgi:hypothetical protein
MFPVVLFVYCVTVWANTDVGSPHDSIISTKKVPMTRTNAAFQIGSDPIFIFAPAPTSLGTANR